MKTIKKKKLRKAHLYGKATVPVQAQQSTTVTHRVTMVMRGRDLMGTLSLGGKPPE